MTVQRRSQSHLTAPRTRGLLGELDLLTPPEWVSNALCAQVDPEMFFPEKGGSTREAKAVCRRCPVAAQCLEYALASEGADSRFGIWGGLSERERRRLRTERAAS